MKSETFDAIIIGGSYSGLSAAMALGRALRKVLVIDDGKPANRYTPHSHNFITHDGRTPGEIAYLAKQQVAVYPSVTFEEGYVIGVKRYINNFHVTVTSGKEFTAKKLILATGIIDQLPCIPGLSACWGKSVLHCPYCHGYEVRSAKTGILGNGEYAFEFGILISNWTNDLQIFTNGQSMLTNAQTTTLMSHDITIVEDPIKEILHTNGSVDRIVLESGKVQELHALYIRPSFTQHSSVSEQLDCEYTPEGYLKIDQMQRTTIAGVFACGDTISRMRTVANAVSTGTIAGMMVNKELVQEELGIST